MWENFIAFIFSIWQIHIAVVGLFLRGHGFTETLLVVAFGSSLGVATCYYSPEAITFCRAVIKPFAVKTSLAKLPPTHFYQELIDFIKYWVVKLNHRPQDNLLRQISIFIITVIPVPNFELMAIAVSRLLKIPHGFKIILFANIFRVLLLVSGVYFGAKLYQFF